MMSDENWFVVQTLPRKERLAQRHLLNQEFRTFLPVQARSGASLRKRPHATSAFFPNYLFVSLDLQRHSWRSINGTIGVARLVSFGQDRAAPPSPLPMGFVEQLIDLSSPDGELRFAEDFAIGDQVRIIGGPFDDLCGVLETAKGPDRVTILLNILTNATRVEVRRDCLLAA